jgi:hypothetical protein
MWKTPAMAAAFCALASAAVAQPRPATTAMTCQQTKALILARGAVVLTTAPYTYDLYVRDQGFCPAAKIAEQAWERTLDQAQCPIGFRCRDLGENSERSGDQ